MWPIASCYGYSSSAAFGLAFVMGARRLAAWSFLGVLANLVVGSDSVSLPCSSWQSSS